MEAYTEKLMEIGNQIGCDMIIAVPSFVEKAIVPKNKFFEKTVERFQALRKLGEKYNFKLGFEPLGPPNNSVRKATDAVKILTAAEEDGLGPSGLVINTFHFFVGEQTPKELAAIPIEKLWLLHFNDCVKKPIKKLQDSDRVWPGLGYFPLTEFIEAAKSIGYDGSVSLELFNPAYWKLPPEEVASKAIESLKKYIE